jgi:hypothetical protein
VELIEKSKTQIIVLGGGCRRDNCKRLVHDNPMLNVNAKFEDLIKRKMEITGRRPSDFRSINKHKKVELNVAAITRVKAFWTTTRVLKKRGSC